jgi:hypothetical protein
MFQKRYLKKIMIFKKTLRNVGPKFIFRFTVL